MAGESITVSAVGKYNIQLNRNTNLENKTTVNYGEEDTSGRMYGYGFAVQLYNESKDKGLKGIEYPKGEISFDIDLKLERNKLGSSELEDITDECTPILWQYRLNDWISNNEGLIEGRSMYATNGYNRYCTGLPLGTYREDSSQYEVSDYSTYNSGNINIVQEKEKLKIIIKDYDFNGIFPRYNSNHRNTSTRTEIYADNIGTFSVGYMQIFVPDNEASTMEDRDYYLTVSDNNMRIISNTGENIVTQMNMSDDSPRVQHVIYKQGSYAHRIMLHTLNGGLSLVSSDPGAGNGRANVGEI